MNYVNSLTFGNKALFLKSASILFITLLIVACGGGSSYDESDCGSESGSSDCMPEQEVHFLYFTGSLSAVDTGNPDIPVQIESGNSLIKSRNGNDLAIQSYSTGLYVNSRHSILNNSLNTLVYAKTDGRFYKVSNDKSIGLNPILVSNESSADHLCMQVEGVPVFDAKSKAEDYSDIDKSQLIYSLSGEDNDCDSVSDNEWKMISLGMDSDESPVEAFPPVTALWNLEVDASIQGWLVIDSGTLKKCDDQFENCGDSLIDDVGHLQHVFGLGMNNHLLLIDGNLYVYDDVESKLSDSVYGLSTGEIITSYAADESDIFFSIGAAIYKAPIDGGAGAVVFSEELWDSPYQAMVHDLHLTDNLVVYTKVPGDVYSGSEIKAINKSGGASETLASSDSSSSVTLMTNGDKIFYSFEEVVLNADGNYTLLPMLAGIMDENGIDLYSLADASWVGWVNSQALNKGVSDSLARLQDKFILGDATNQELSGIGLSSFATSTGDKLLSLGSLHDLEGLLGINCRSADSDEMLCEVAIETMQDAAASELRFQNDILYLNAEVSESLVRVTDTEDVSESAIRN